MGLLSLLSTIVVKDFKTLVKCVIKAQLSVEHHAGQQTDSFSLFLLEIYVQNLHKM